MPVTAGVEHGAGPGTKSSVPHVRPHARSRHRGAGSLRSDVTPKPASQTRATTFEGAFAADPMATVLKVFILVVSGFGLFYSRVHLEARRLMRGEYFVFGLSAVLGMLVLVSAGSFLTPVPGTGAARRRWRTCVWW